MEVMTGVFFVTMTTEVEEIEWTGRHSSTQAVVLGLAVFTRQ